MNGKSMPKTDNLSQSSDLFTQFEDRELRGLDMPSPAAEVAASSRRFDEEERVLLRAIERLTRNLERIERQITISNEALGLYVRFWLTVTPPVPEAAEQAAQAKGRQRYEAFVQAIGRRLAKGRSLAQDVGLRHAPSNRPSSGQL